MSDVVIRFKALSTSPRGPFRNLLLAVRYTHAGSIRKILDGPVTVEINGIHQDWWDEEQAEAERRYAEWGKDNR